MRASDISIGDDADPVAKVEGQDPPEPTAAEGRLEP
jgi:hypothetical protein